jgi:outer membrane protein W
MVVVLGIGISASAQDDVVWDVAEVCFHGGLGIPAGGIGDFHDSLGATTGWSVGLDIGYFLRYNMVIGFSFKYTQLGIDPDMGIDAASQVENEHHRLYTPSLYLKYYFYGESNFEPYLKGHVGVENPKFYTDRNKPTRKFMAVSYDPSLALGFGAGLFYYTSDFSGLYLEANYHWANTKEASRDYPSESVVFGDNLGLLDIHGGVRILIGPGE